MAGEELVTGDGYGAVTGDGLAATTDCPAECCEPTGCPYYLRARRCNADPCLLPAPVAYFCAEISGPLCTGGIIVGTVFRTFDEKTQLYVCWRVESIDQYVVCEGGVPAPPGFLCLPAGALTFEAAECFPPPPAGGPGNYPCDNPVLCPPVPGGQYIGLRACACVVNGGGGIIALMPVAVYLQQVIGLRCPVAHVPPAQPGGPERCATPDTLTGCIPGTPGIPVVLELSDGGCCSCCSQTSEPTCLDPAQGGFITTYSVACSAGPNGGQQVVSWQERTCCCALPASPGRRITVDIAFEASSPDPGPTGGTLRVRHRVTGTLGGLNAADVLTRVSQHDTVPSTPGAIIDPGWFNGAYYVITETCGPAAIPAGVCLVALVLAATAAAANCAGVLDVIPASAPGCTAGPPPGHGPSGTAVFAMPPLQEGELSRSGFASYGCFAFSERGENVCASNSNCTINAKWHRIVTTQGFGGANCNQGCGRPPPLPGIPGPGGGARAMGNGETIEAYMAADPMRGCHGCGG